MSIDERADPIHRGSAAAASADELARVAAEVTSLVEHHRDELRAAMEELTALQRTVRSEIRDAIHELDRIAAGATGPSSDEPASPTPPRRRRLPVRRRAS